MTNILAGLYGFKPTDIFTGFNGNDEDGLSHIGHVMNALQTLHDVNRLDLQVYDHTVEFDDGTVVTAHRMFGQYSVTIEVPNRSGLQPGQFYWVPGCVARYDGRTDWKNVIPDGALAGEFAYGVGDKDGNTKDKAVSYLKTGLPTAGSSPDGSIARDYGVMVMPGNDLSEIYENTDSGLKFSTAHIVSNGSFTISCVVKLNKNIDIDYSFSEKNKRAD